MTVTRFRSIPQSLSRELDNSGNSDEAGPPEESSGPAFSISRGAPGSRAQLGSELFRQGWGDLEQVTHNAIVGYVEYRGVFVFVDRYNLLG